MISQQINNTKTFSDGLILVDKPVDMTSFDVTRIVGKALHIKKVGHCGTLDKNATGLMLVCFGKATKILTYLIGQNKRYIGQIYFGIATTTDDATGETIAHYDGEFDFAKIENVLKSYVGTINQIPPKYSSIHVNGQRAYQLAVSNQDFEIKPREITIQQLDITKIEKNIVTIDVHCSSGTYIRSIARDAGLDTGYFGHIYTLRRMNVGKFNVANANTIEQIKSGNFNIINTFDLIHKLDYPILKLKQEYKKYFIDGKQLKNDIFETNIQNGINCVICENSFMGIIEKDKEKTIYKFVY